MYVQPQQRMVMREYMHGGCEQALAILDKNRAGGGGTDDVDDLMESVCGSDTREFGLNVRISSFPLLPLRFGSEYTFPGG